MASKTLETIYAGNPLSSLTGNEPIYTVSGGQDAAFLASVLAQYGISQIPKASTSAFGLAKVDGSTITASGGVLSATAQGLTVGTTAISGGTTGDLLYDSGGVLANASLSAIVDGNFGSAEGDILYRGASGWAALAPGTSGNFLKTQGTSNPPVWAAAPAAALTVNSTAISGGTAGYLLYDNGGTLEEASLGATLNLTGGVLSAPGALILAAANMTWYVATTGSDSNAGTSGSPFLTIQHAVNVAAGYNYQGLYTATINVADGTYAVNGAAPAVTLPALVNYPQNAFPSLIGDETTPTNCVISNTGGDAVAADWYSFWNVEGFRLKSTSGTSNDLNAQNYSSLQITDIDFAGSGNLLTAQNYSWVGVTGNVTSSTTSAVRALYAFFYSSIVNDTSTWTFNNSPAFSGEVARVIDHAILGYGTLTGTATGNRFVLQNNGIIELNVARSSFPGNGTCIIDQPSWFAGDTNSVVGTYQNTSASLASSIVLSDGAGNSRADYNITNAGHFSFLQDLYIQTASTADTGFNIVNTSTGGRSLAIGSVGSAGNFNLPVGAGFFIDLTSGDLPLWWDTSANVGLWGRLGWGASSGGSYSVPTIDTGLSRTAAATLAVGNGTAGDFSGTLQLATLTATGVPTSKSGTATSSTAMQVLGYSTTSGLGIYTGTGAPTFSAPKGSLYIRIDGAAATALYLNTTASGSGTTWSAVT